MAWVLAGHLPVLVAVRRNFRDQYWTSFLGVVWGHVRRRSQMVCPIVPAARVALRNMSAFREINQSVGQLVDPVGL